MEKHYVFSAPGRTEIGGNHTDHQHGCVLAAAVDLETVAEVTLNETDCIRVRSEGYPEVVVDLKDLSVREEEKNTTAALVRGVAAAFTNKGAKLRGFDAEVRSNVLPGSGLSSSAAFEVLMGTICNELFFDKQLSAIEIAQIGQYAENVYFGKPCGLMDQMASSVGNLVFIDFEDPEQPVVERINFDFKKAGYAIMDEVIRYQLGKIKMSSESQVVADQHEKAIELARARLRIAEMQLAEKAKELSDYQAETIRVIRGESRLSGDLLNELVDKTKGEITELSAVVEAAKQELSERMSSAQQEQQEFEKLQSWADLYDNCTFAAKKMIVSQFIKAVYVYRDYTLEVEFNVSFDEFKALSANCTNEGNEKATVHPVNKEKDRLAI